MRQTNHPFPNLNYRINNIPYEEWMDSAHVSIRHRACECDGRLKPVNVSYKIKETPFDVALRVDTMDIIVHDTTYIDVHDTTYIPVHDTTYIPVHDTTYIDVHDTTYIYVHDTTYIPVHDTTYIDVHDTTYIPVHDTTYIDVHDTVILTKIVTKYDAITLTKIVTKHDTVRVEVPVYIREAAPEQKSRRRRRPRKADAVEEKNRDIRKEKEE